MKKFEEEYYGFRKREGFWYSPHPHNINYPFPIPDVLSESEAIRLHSLIKKKELFAEKFAYMGVSVSRIDGTKVSSREYHTDKWIWPDGFADHYVLKYRVKPSDEFIRYIEE